MTVPRTLALRLAPGGRLLQPTAVELGLAAAVACVLGAIAVLALAAPMTVRVFLLLGVALPFAAILVGGLKRLLLTVALVNISLGWDINFAYNADAAALGAIGGFGFSLTTIALAGLFALWLAESLAKPDVTPRLRLRWVWPGALYVALTALSVLVAQDRQLSLFELALILQGFLLFLYVATFVRTTAEVRFIIGVLLLAFLGQGLLIIATRYLGVDPQLPGLSPRTDVGTEITRVAGTLGSPNSAGSYLASMVVLAISTYIARVRAPLQRLAPLAIALGAVALIQTFSRGAWLALAVALTVLFALFAARRLVSRRVVAVAAVAAVVALGFGGAVADRFAHGPATGEARVSLLETSFDVIHDHPFLGVGANNFVVALPSYSEMTRWVYIPHNKLALVWAEAGTGAFLAFLVLLVAVLRRAWLALRHADDTLFPYAAGVAAAFLALCVHMNFEPFHDSLQTQLFWLFSGLATALWAMRRPVSERRGIA